ncbi:MAG: RnfABCDGE type electron transport complex subunit B [Spirochaetaceae bacterium]
MVLRILYSFLTVAVLGGALGLGLAIAARILAVKKDERVERVEGVLPGANCGACGYAGCSAYAEAIVNEGAEINLCSPGGAETVKAVAQIMGQEVEAGSSEKQVARVHCRGTQITSTYLYAYRGVKDCNAMHMFFGGDKECKYGCLGLGSCMKVCPVDAIYYEESGQVRVDRDICISCGKCVDVCPTGVMKMVPYSADYIVACNSTDKGGKVRKYCKVGCIGCGVCAKKSPEGGFVVENFLASIDYSAQGSREEAVKACPPKCIVPVGAKEVELIAEESREEEESKEKEGKKVVNEKA